MAREVEFENDRVRVTRVSHAGAGGQSSAARHDRLIVYLQDSTVTRTEGGRQEEIERRAGDVAWRDASEHTVEVKGDGPHEVLIIELKS